MMQVQFYIGLAVVISLAVGVIYWQGRNDESTENKIEQYEVNDAAQKRKSSVAPIDSAAVADSLRHGKF